MCEKISECAIITFLFLYVLPFVSPMKMFRASFANEMKKILSIMKCKRTLIDVICRLTVLTPCNMLVVQKIIYQY